MSIEMDTTVAVPIAQQVGIVAPNGVAQLLPSQHGAAQLRFALARVVTEDEPKFEATGRRAVGASVLMAVFALAAAIVAMYNHDPYTGLVLGALLIPGCGATGLRRRSLRCVLSFYSFSGMCAMLFGGISLFTLASSIPTVNCLCDPACRDEKYSPSLQNNTAIVDLCEHKSSILQTYQLLLSLGLITAVLQLVTCWWGRDLYNILARIHYRDMTALDGSAVLDEAPVQYTFLSMGGSASSRPPIMDAGSASGGLMFASPLPFNTPNSEHGSSGASVGDARNRTSPIRVGARGSRAASGIITGAPDEPITRTQSGGARMFVATAGPDGTTMFERPPRVISRGSR